MDKFVQFFLQIGKLKKLKRTGWVRSDIPNPESVAEHSFRTAVMAAVFSEQLGLDQLKSIRMALFHDIGEAKSGDPIKTMGGVDLPDKIEKVKMEREAFLELVSLIHQKQYVGLLDEYNNNKTPEARLVKELDKLEMAIQAYEYETEHNIDLETFFESSRVLIHSEEIKKILQEIEKLRGK